MEKKVADWFDEQVKAHEAGEPVSEYLDPILLRAFARTVPKRTEAPQRAPQGETMTHG